MAKEVVNGKAIIPPGMSHEVKARRPVAGPPRRVQDSSDKFIEWLAGEWYSANKIELLMTWAQGPSNGLDVVVRTYLGDQRLRSDWKDPRLGRRIVELMKEDVGR